MRMILLIYHLIRLFELIGLRNKMAKWVVAQFEKSMFRFIPHRNKHIQESKWCWRQASEASLISTHHYCVLKRKSSNVKMII